MKAEVEHVNLVIHLQFIIVISNSAFQYAMHW